ncbi:SHOCT domain-containing protein [Gillisia sp. JM1]|uniref:SHOCT domain-containing protein n=1 Tax=Gillisia sp. JM1 TaxID=1283286 RepID=UPI0004203818|nr:SHOCT domain-containing protein [Gillisia sp. JM1]
MKKITYLTIVLLTLNFLQAQNVEKLDEFTASNGITYKVGDDFKLGRGSDTNGRFVYVNMGGWGAIAGATNNANYNADQNRLGAANSGLIVTLKKIKKYDSKRFKGVYFTVGGGNITNYTIDIENAIVTCEIEICNDEKDVSQSNPDKYDQLEKLKKLLDTGVLTQEEYDVEKKKVLEKE